MIQYSLKCTNGHRFDSWFKSAEAYDKLLAAGMISCAICGSHDVQKSIMAPQVRTTKGEKEASKTPSVPLSAPSTKSEKALAEVKKYIEKNSCYVGSEFASKARAMHEGDLPERVIHGEARVEEARQLVDDGIPITPLPFMPTRKTN
ncbi:MAG: DUF1178 family protein [Aestuariivita sp.]|nr:DUF1178 family protein [Aestuariivita sp.]